MIATQAAIAPLLEIKDERFDSDKCAEYELMLELGGERLRFLVLDSASKQVLYLEDYFVNGLPGDKNWTQWLGQVFEEHPFGENYLWKKVIICFNTPFFTLIPDAYFRKEYINSYLSLVRGEISESEQLLHQEVKNVAARNVFAINKGLWEWVQNTYSLQSPTFIHQTNALIEGTLVLSQREKNETLMSLYFEDDFVTLTIAQNQNLLYCNKLGYKMATDMGYFVMFVLDSLQLKPGDIHGYLFGEVTAYSEDYQLLKKFLPHLQFGNTPPNLVLGTAFDDLPEHRYFSLYNIFSTT